MYPLIRRYLRRVDVVYLLLCAALFLTLLAGCGKQEEPAEDFVVSAAVCGPLETLDPTMNTDVGTESLLSTLFAIIIGLPLGVLLLSLIHI